MHHETDWLLDEIASGLQGLVCLGLPWTPASELLTATARVWLRALSTLDWSEERDVPRIRAAFLVLERTREAWPQPKHLLEAMPAPNAQPRLEAPPADPERAKAAIAEAQELLAPFKRDVRAAAAGPDA